MSTTAPDKRITTYRPTAATTEFAAMFPIFDNDDIKVFVDGQERENFVVSATYVEGVSTNAKAVFAIGVTGKVEIVGYRDPHRQNQFLNGGPLPVRDLNLALNTVEAEMQEARRDIERALKVAYGETPSDATELSQSVEEAKAAAEAAIGAANGQFRFDSIASFVAASIPVLINAVDIFGYYAPGDGGASKYSKLGSTPSPVRPWHKQTADGAWWVLSSGILRPQMFGAKSDAVFDCAPPTNDALKCADSRGGGTVLVPAGGTHLIKSGLNLTGLSNVSLVGEPGWGSRIKCSADLNGANNDTKNDAIYALNFTGQAGPDGYPHKNLEVSGLVIDCSLMSGSGIVVDSNGNGIPDWQPGEPVNFGRSLAGVEFLNVDYGVIENNIIIGAFGNGAVISTVDPRLFNDTELPNGVRNPIIEGNIFVDCVRGPLPQYGSTEYPDGITGSVLQIGSAHGGRIHKNYCIRPGGPFSDTFNCQGTEITENYIEGGSVTQIGASSAQGAARHQNTGTIHSDFGLSDVNISDNVFIDTGGIDLDGYMGNTSFFNGYTRTPGPQRCTIERNKLFRPQGRVITGAPAMPASGGTITHNFANRQPVKIYFSGGSGLTLTYRRGVGASFVSKSLTSEGLIVLYYGDALTVSYTTAPSWVWFLAPNVDLPGIRVNGGSIAGFPGRASANSIRDNKIIGTGTHGIEGHDAANNFIKDNYIESPGALPGSSAIILMPRISQVGGGSSNNKIRDNTIIEDRAGFLHSNIRILDATYSLNNQIEGNTLAAAAGSLPLDSVTNYVGKNFGPGAVGGWTGGGQFTPPATNAESAPPGPGDWFATITGGTVTAIATGKPGLTQSMASTAGTFPVLHGEVLKITYSSAPALYWKRAY